ncbi:MAG: hypothetical protein KBT36_15740 [Kurthia sp.]|nr:hypothetical protein [Candidatus Kurthia equi]
MKAYISYLMIGIFLILGFAIFQQLASFLGMTSSDGVVNMQYKVVNPMFFCFFVAVWAMIFGYSLSKQSLKDEVIAFVRNKNTQFFSQQVVIASYSIILAVIIMGVIYGLYILNVLQGAQVFDLMTLSSTSRSLCISTVFLFASANLGYAYGEFKNAGWSWRFYTIVLVIIIIFVFLGLHVTTTIFVSSGVAGAILLPCMNYWIVKKAGEK